MAKHCMGRTLYLEEGGALIHTRDETILYTRIAESISFTFFLGSIFHFPKYNLNISTLNTAKFGLPLNCAAKYGDLMSHYMMVM